MMRGSGALGLASILRHVQPALDQILVGFQMKLQPISSIAESKCLVRAGLCAGQVYRARWKVEGVRMPLEHVLGAVEVAAKWISTGGGRWMQAIPADLAHVVGPHVGAERRGQQLRAQTDAEDGNAAGQRILDGGDFGG